MINHQPSLYNKSESLLQLQMASQEIICDKEFCNGVDREEGGQRQKIAAHTCHHQLCRIEVAEDIQHLLFRHTGDEGQNAAAHDDGFKQIDEVEGSDARQDFEAAQGAEIGDGGGAVQGEDGAHGLNQDEKQKDI